MLTIKPLDKEIVDKLSVGLPQEIIKTRPGGHGKDLDYVSGSTVIDILNNAFGHNWSWAVKEFWREDSIPFYSKNDNSRENGIPQGPIIHCLGTLTAQFYDDNGDVATISKDGFGAKAIVGGQSDQKDNYKSAATDALKKAASLFGIAAQLYRDENEQFFYESINYVDPWADEEVYAAHAEEREYIKNYIDRHNHSALERAVYEWSSGSITEINDLNPDELTAFVNFLKKREVQPNDTAQSKKSDS